MSREIPYENEEQAALFNWWNHAGIRFNIHQTLLFAIPNGGYRNKITAKKLKEQGVQKGIPDIFLAIPRNNYHGLFIELKRTKKGRLTKEQNIAIKLLKAEGYQVEVAYGFLHAKDIISQYLNQDISKWSFCRTFLQKSGTTIKSFLNHIQPFHIS